MQLVIRTFDELRKFAHDFATGHFRLLVVIGGAGLSKSTVFRAEGKQCDAKYIEAGNLTAFALYCTLYEERDKPIILDDLDGIYNDKNGVRLMKQITQSEPVRTIGWHSTAVGPKSVSAKEAEEGNFIPKSFETASRLVLILNCWEEANANVRALEDRGLILSFQPTAEEVHKAALTWFKDAEISEWIGQRLAFIDQHSQRSYINAADLKAAGHDWRTALYTTWKVSQEAVDFLSNLGEIGKRWTTQNFRDWHKNPDFRKCWEIMCDKSFETEEARAQAFVTATGKGRATYFNYQRTLPHPNPIKRGRKKGEPSRKNKTAS